jgi:hypothetical protein
MSSYQITLIPADPNYVPPADAQEAARKLLETFVPEADEVTAETRDQLDFHTGNGNWSGVLCPFCGADIQDWFFAKVDEKYADAWRDLSVITPCCGKQVSLNDMNFVWPAGFALFSLEAQEPNIYDLEPTKIQVLENTLGCKLRRIWVHT